MVRKRQHQKVRGSWLISASGLGDVVSAATATIMAAIAVHAWPAYLAWEALYASTDTGALQQLRPRKPRAPSYFHSPAARMSTSSASARRRTPCFSRASLGTTIGKLRVYHLDNVTDCKPTSSTPCQAQQGPFAAVTTATTCLVGVGWLVDGQWCPEWEFVIIISGVQRASTPEVLRYTTESGRVPPRWSWWDVAPHTAPSGRGMAGSTPTAVSSDPTILSFSQRSGPQGKRPTLACAWKQAMRRGSTRVQARHPTYPAGLA